MADRIPLIVNPGANQIQETPTNDRLIVGLTTIATNAGINQTGVITATTFNAGGGTFGNIRIAIADDNTIDTSSGDLVLDASGNDVTIHSDCQLEVDNTTDAVSQSSGALVVSGGMSCEKKLFVGTILNLASTSNTDTTFVQNATTDSSSKTTGAATFAGGVGIAKKLHVGSEINCDGDITAFASDIRLKTSIEPLNNALEKISSLNGFTYKFNETGGSLGFNTEITYVGVSAQEVQEVLPQAVKPAPSDSNYYTVQYEKLVPLLIEAIKELKAEVEELKTHTH